MVDPPGNDDDHGDLDALDFSAAHTNEASPLDALDDYAPVQTDDAEGDLTPSMRSPNATRSRSWSCSR